MKNHLLTLSQSMTQTGLPQVPHDQFKQLAEMMIRGMNQETWTAHLYRKLVQQLSKL